MIRELKPADWRGFRQPDFPHESWAIHEGTIVTRHSQSPCDLITREHFADFALRFEWCVPEAGNSGVLYRVSEDAEESWQSGPEMQLLDDRRHPDGDDPLTSCGALYGLVAPVRRISPAAGAYHAGALIVRGFAIEHWIAGVRVLSCDLESRGIRSQIAASKFADLTLFAGERKGHIVLQHHGAGAAFRRLEIEVL